MLFCPQTVPFRRSRSLARYAAKTIRALSSANLQSRCAESDGSAAVYARLTSLRELSPLLGIFRCGGLAKARSAAMKCIRGSVQRRTAACRCSARSERGGPRFFSKGEIEKEGKEGVERAFGCVCAAAVRIIIIKVSPSHYPPPPLLSLPRLCVRSSCRYSALFG